MLDRSDNNSFPPKDTTCQFHFANFNDEENRSNTKPQPPEGAYSNIIDSRGVNRLHACSSDIPLTEYPGLKKNNPMHQRLKPVLPLQSYSAKKATARLMS
jgi:hypothetical protein